MIDAQTIKPGHKTSELYVTIIPMFVMILVAMGYISKDDAKHVEYVIAGVLASIVWLGGKYTEWRSRIKIQDIVTRYNDNSGLTIGE